MEGQLLPKLVINNSLEIHAYILGTEALQTCFHYVAVTFHHSPTDCDTSSGCPIPFSAEHN